MTTIAHEKDVTTFWIDPFDTAHAAVNVSAETTLTEARETALERMSVELWNRGAATDWTPALMPEPHITELGHGRFLVEFVERMQGRVL